jgi:pimeloyl-ACP methyl ester carboxylesterase
MSTYVLIHGAWHGAWCWEKAVPLLEAKGHRVVAIDLPGHGQDKTPASTVTLQAYADRVCEAVAAQSEPVILVGHSMGGVVITQAAEQCAENVAALGYVCAFLPRNAEALQDWASQDAASMVNPNSMVPSADGLTLTFREDAARDAFYGECSDADSARATARLVPQAAAALETPVRLTGQRFGRIPRFYVECARDQAITLPLQKRMHQASPCKEVFSIDTDHSPFFSAAEELTNILLRMQAALPARAKA